MNGDVNVRFCERLGVKLPGATHRVGFRLSSDFYECLLMEKADPQKDWLHTNTECYNWPLNRNRNRWITAGDPSILT